MPTRITSPDGLFEAWIEVEGKEVEVLMTVHKENGRVSTAFIVAEIDKRFMIGYKVKEIPDASKSSGGRFYPNIGVRTEADGFHIAECGYTSEKLRQSCTDMVDGIEARKDTVLPLIFKQPSDSVARLTAAQAGCVGTISEEFSRRSFSTALVPKLYDSVPVKHAGLHEKDKKGQVGVIVGSGAAAAAIKPVATECYSCKTFPGDQKKPFYSIRFQYAPRDVLLAAGIIEGENDRQTAESLGHRETDTSIIDVHGSDFAGEKSSSGSDTASMISDGGDPDDPTEIAEKERRVKIQEMKAKVQQMEAEMEGSKNKKRQANSDDEDDLHVDRKDRVREYVERQMRRRLREEGKG